MATVQALRLHAPTPAVPDSSLDRTESNHSRFRQHGNQSWNSLRQNLKCNGRASCLFSDNRKQEQARKALESALGGKKNELEKWSREIKKREEMGGGGNSGKGGSFGWGGWFGGFSGDNFWQEAKQTILTILGIILMYLIIAKGEVMVAVVFNPLLFALRGIRNGLTSVASTISRKINPNGHSSFDDTPKTEIISRVSAKEKVVSKWGSDQ